MPRGGGRSGCTQRFEMGEPAQDFFAGVFGTLEGVEVAACDPTEVLPDQLPCTVQSSALQFARMGACDEGQRALVRVLLKRGQQAVRHGAVNGGFHVTLVAQAVSGMRRQGFQPM